MKRNALIGRIEKQKHDAALEAHRFTRQLIVDLSYIALAGRALAKSG